MSYYRKRPGERGLETDQHSRFPEGVGDAPLFRGRQKVKRRPVTSRIFHPGRAPARAEYGGPPRLTVEPRPPALHPMPGAAPQRRKRVMTEGAYLVAPKFPPSATPGRPGRGSGRSRVRYPGGRGRQALGAARRAALTESGGGSSGDTRTGTDLLKRATRTRLRAKFDTDGRRGDPQFDCPEGTVPAFIGDEFKCVPSSSEKSAPEEENDSFDEEATFDEAEEPIEEPLPPPPTPEDPPPDVQEPISPPPPPPPGGGAAPAPAPPEYSSSPPPAPAPRSTRPQKRAGFRVTGKHVAIAAGGLAVLYLITRK